VQEAAEEVAPLFASGRKAQDEFVASYSEKELELLAEFFENSVTMWDEEREKLQRRKAVTHKDAKDE
jgi:hypothetical protein